MLQRITTIFTLVLLIGFSAQAQERFTKLPSGLEYKFTKNNPSGKKATIGSNITLHIVTSLEDSIIFDSKKLNKNQAVPTPVTAPKHRGDLQEGFAMMKVGEKAIFKSLIDSAMRVKQQWPPFAKSGDVMKFEVELVSVKTKEDQELEAKQADANDEIAIKKYIAENGLGKKVKKTASGLYYLITKKGTGPNAKPGQTVSMNYDGMLINGSKFDSNTDSAFNHVQPFNFPLGQGRVIKGWDEGIALLNTGAKAKLIIPSRLAYGSRSMGAKIPANSPLIFDVEMLGTVEAPKPKPAAKPMQNEATDPASEEKAIAAYIKSNGLLGKAKRTPSGLYYVITKLGDGARAKSGQTVSMNYTGYLLNGNVFDSNVDPKFNHVQPFDFPLGQGRVIQGWDEGIALLNTGSKAKLIIPSRLGYGSRSMGAKIPANSILIFDVEMLGTK
jgi:FKBP-type peptidyl-prolyl cis-trans isomerase